MSVAIREAFNPEDWEEMEQEYVSGKFTVEESNIRQYARLRASRQKIEEFVRGDVVVRYAFDEFADYCHGTGIRLSVVSSGLDFYVNTTIDALDLEGVDVHAARTEFTPEGIRVAYEDPAGALITSGFKDSYVSHFKGLGHTVVYIGDGLSDFGPARLADHVIARNGLADYMERHGLAHDTFETFRDVGKHVERIRSSLSETDSSR